MMSTEERAKINEEIETLRSARMSLQVQLDIKEEMLFVAEWDETFNAAIGKCFGRDERATNGVLVAYKLCVRRDPKTFAAVEIRIQADKNGAIDVASIARCEKFFYKGENLYGNCPEVSEEQFNKWMDEVNSLVRVGVSE